MNGISFIIPSYNEGSLCGRTAISAARALEEVNAEGEALVYDDFSDECCLFIIYSRSPVAPGRVWHPRSFGC